MKALLQSINLQKANKATSELGTHTLQYSSNDLSVRWLHVCDPHLIHFSIQIELQLFDLLQWRTQLFPYFLIQNLIQKEKRITHISYDTIAWKVTSRGSAFLPCDVRTAIEELSIPLLQSKKWWIIMRTINCVYDEERRHQQCPSRTCGNFSRTSNHIFTFCSCAMTGDWALLALGQTLTQRPFMSRHHAFQMLQQKLRYQFLKGKNVLQWTQTMKKLLLLWKTGEWSNRKNIKYVWSFKKNVLKKSTKNNYRMQCIH